MIAVACREPFMSLPKPVAVLVLSALLLSSAPSQTIARGKLADPEDARAYSDVLKQIRARRLSVAWKDTPLSDAVKELRIHLDRTIIFTAAAGEKKDAPVSLELFDVSVATTMRQLQAFAKVRFLFEGGVLFVTTPEDAAQRSLEIRVYDVSDLLYRAPDFPGPSMDLHPGKPGSPPDEVPAERRDGSELADLLRTLVGSEPWDVPGTSITISHHLLIVRQTPEVHAKIKELVLSLAAFL
jgi:hypothetical protein